MCQTIAIFSIKGGVGKTFIATNLAVSLAADQQKKVALVDLDMLAVNDIARLLGLSPNRALVDINSAIEKESPELFLREVIFRHQSGLDFLTAILNPRQAGQFNPLILGKIFEELEKTHDFIIVDCGKVFSDTLLASLNQANSIMLVVTPDILSVYQTKQTLDILQSLLFPLKMIKIILNRSESPGGVSWQEVKTALSAEIVAKIPSEGKTVGLAINRQIPVILDSPRARVSLLIKELAKNLVTRQEIFMPRHEIEGSLSELLQKQEFWLKRGLTAPSKETKTMFQRDEIIDLKRRIHEKLIEELDLRHSDLTTMDAQKTRQIREKTEQAIANLLAREAGAFISSTDVRKRLIKEIADEALGLGPLEDLIAQQDISDILVNNKDQIYIERHGKIELTPKRFVSNEQVRQVIERIVAPLGRRIDESVPMIDARLADGSRVNAIIPPLSLTGPTLTIRKFGTERLQINDLIRLSSISEPMAKFIEACVLARKNIIVSGGTGSGKTTVLNVLSKFIPQTERIITIEDAAELRLSQEHWVRLESRPPNIEGRGAITIRDLFRNTLRMRPDRIIVGECRGAETLDMLQAMNTGHDGSMTTIHANSTHDVFTRLDSMILMFGTELPVRAIREMIAAAIHMIVHTARLSDGSRKVMQITEVTGMLDELHIGLADIFGFKQTGLDKDGKVLGHFKATGKLPTFYEELKTRGIVLPEEMFKA